MNPLILRELIGAWFDGGYISLHGAAPGSNGSNILAGPSRTPPGGWTITSDGLVNGVRFDLDAALRGGLAQYVGFWRRDRIWLFGGRMEAVQIEVGIVFGFPRNTLRVSFGAS